MILSNTNGTYALKGVLAVSTWLAVRAMWCLVSASINTDWSILLNDITPLVCEKLVSV